MSTNQLSNEDITAMRVLFDESARLLQAGDFESWSQLWTENAVLMPPNSPSVKGRSAILAFGQAYPKILSMSFTDVEITGKEDLAVATTALSMTLAPEGAEEIQDTGKQVVILRKDSGGKWLVDIAIFNSDLEGGQ